MHLSKGSGVEVVRGRFIVRMHPTLTLTLTLTNTLTPLLEVQLSKGRGVPSVRTHGALALWDI